MIVREQQEGPLTMTETTLFLPGLSPVSGKTITAEWRRLDPARDRKDTRSRHGAQPVRAVMPWTALRIRSALNRWIICR
jgi:hypothetical protein